MTTTHLYRKTKFCLSLCIMTVVMMTCGALRANAATETITIGEGTAITDVAPFNCYEKNITVQMLYTADEIGKKGIINSIAFHVASTNKTLDCTELKIYMGETDATSILTYKPYTGSDLTLVYSTTNKTIGSASGWETYTLDTPFSYGGTKNLVVAVCRKSESGNVLMRYTCTNVEDRVIFRGSDSNADYADIDYNAYIVSSNDLPNVQFSMETSGHVMEHHAAVAPTATTAGNYEYWYCTTHCQKYFKDKFGDEEYGDNEWVIPAGECPHLLTEHAAVPNTCSDDGSALYYKCDICGKYFSDANGENEIEAGSWVMSASSDAHQYDNGICTICSALQTPNSQTIGGVLTFDIANEGNALYVCNYVNEGNTCAARLVADNVKFKGGDYMNLTAGKLTLDLNGNTLSTTGYQAIKVAGCNLTITDSSDGKTGAVINGSGYAINATSGSLAVNAGTFVCNSGFAVQTSSSCTSLSISGGKYFARNSTYTIYTPGKSALAEGYSYYNARTGEELTDYTDRPISVSNPADTVIVKPAAVRAVLTKGGTSINYTDFNAAFAAAQECTANDNATLKLMKSRIVDGSQGYITFSAGTFTLDLNGDTLQTSEAYCIYVNGANVTITDSSEGKTGAVINQSSQTIYANSGSLIINGGNFMSPSCNVAIVNGGTLTINGGEFYAASNYSYYAVNAVSGSLIITGGKFKSQGGYALNTSSSCTLLSVSGGTYKTVNGTPSSINTPSKSALAEGYSYYNGDTGEELPDCTNQPIYVSAYVDSIVVKPASVKAVLTKGGTSINYTDFNAAFAAAQECTANDNATLKLMQNYVLNPIYSNITFTTGTFTLDLNGDTISNNSSETIKINGANVTITDSSEGKKGTVINQANNAVCVNSGSLTINGGNYKSSSGNTAHVGGGTLTINGGEFYAASNYSYYAVNAVSGSLIITGGKFKSQGGYALNTSSSCTLLSVSGGTYKTVNGTPSSINTPSKSALAEGYSYYNGDTGEELPDYTTQPIYVSAYVDSIVVKPASLKAVLTKNGEDVNYYSFDSAFAAAQRCTADDNATLKLMKSRIVDSSKGNITFSAGTFTLDLNGDTIRNHNSCTILINGANLTVTDSSEGKTGAIVNTGAYSLDVMLGSLTVDGGNYTAGNGNPSVHSSQAENNTVVTLKDGTLNNGIYLNSYATLNLPSVALFGEDGSEYSAERNPSGYISNISKLTINPYYTVGTAKHKLTKEGDNYYADNFVLTDGMAFTSEHDFTAATAEYSRTMTNKWGTLCLPFALTIDNAQPYTLYNVDGVEDGVLKVFKRTSTVEAGTPVIVRRDNTANGISITAENVEVDATTHCNDWGDITLYGTYAEKTINNGYYIANDKFWDAANYNGDVTVAPYRAYMLTTLLCAKSLSIFAIDEDTTAIDSVDENEGESCADTWRTLDGKPLNGKPTMAGIYLHGNVKVVVK